MRLESLVIVDDYGAVNGTPIFVHTARHVMEIGGVRRTVTGWVDLTLGF
jgi:hypothetical protein